MITGTGEPAGNQMVEISPNLPSYLRQVPFMRNLPAAYRQELARICTLQHYDVGQEIIPQGFITDRFFVVVEGHVHFRKTDSQGLWHPAGDARPGQHFGLAMFTTQALSDYKAEALTATTVYVMERPAFDRLVEAQPNILKAMRPILLRRQQLTRGFKWLTPGEDIVLTTHRHWFALIESIAAPVLAGLLLAGVLLIADYFGFLAMVPFGPYLAAIPVLLIAAWLAYGVNDYIDDDFIVTNKRVAQVERVFVKKELRYQIPNNKIQSISVRRVGPLASALKISDLEVRSAGRADSRIVFDRVARAEEIRQTIQEQRGKMRAQDEAEMRRRFRGRVEKDLTPYIFKKPTEEESPEKIKTRPRRSWLAFLRGVWNRMFGRKFVDAGTVIYRKHWVALMRQAGRWILFLIVLTAVLAVYLTAPLLDILPRIPTLAALGFLFLVDLGGLAWQWEDWRNDIYQLTGNQIIDIERSPFGLKSRSTEALLTNVQDARALRPNSLNAVLNFGNVEVQTAGGGPPLTFYDVATPEEIVEEIFARMEALRLRIMEHEMIVLGQKVTDALITYDHMKEKRNGLLASGATASLQVTQVSLPPGTGPTVSAGDGEEKQPAAETPDSKVASGQILEEFSSAEVEEESP